MSQSSRYFLAQAELREYEEQHPDERHYTSQRMISEGEHARRDQAAYRAKFTDAEWREMEERYKKGHH